MHIYIYIYIYINEHERSEIPNEDIIQTAEFVLKNNFFEFNGEVKRQESGNQVQQLLTNLHLLTLAISWMTKFRESQKLQSFF